MFWGSKSNKSSEYHTEMNWDVFSRWCDTKVFLKMKSIGIKSVSVLDQAIYHTVINDADRKPISSWKKTRICKAISRWRGATEDRPLIW